MKPIRCAIFDIDGTLINRGQQFINPAVVSAIHQLQAQNIEVIVATGRAYFFILKEVKTTLKPNFTVTINGACIYGKDGEIVKKTDMDKQDVATLIHLAREHGIALGFKCEHNVTVYNQYDIFLKEYLHGFDEGNILIDRTKERQMIDEPMGAFMIGDINIINTFTASVPNTIMVEAHQRAYDIFPKSAGKENALEYVLASLDLFWDETIAFGDSANDINMIEKAAIGVAMGNGTAACKAAADYVTDSVVEDGIATALQHFKLI